MRRERVATTRFELLRMRRRLERVRTGADLLARRRRALVGELLRTARPALEARRRVAGHAQAAYEALLRAQSLHDAVNLESLAHPAREIRAVLRPIQVWGVAAAELVEHDPVRRAPVARGLDPGAAGPAVGTAAARFEALTEELLAAAARELLIRQLARALTATARQVNRLERRVAPALEAEIRRVRSSLGEREREDRTRVRRLLARGPGRPGTGARGALRGSR